MTEVARLAGVSVSTVSHIVHGTRPVASATRHRVLDAMRQLKFERSGSGSSPVVPPTVGFAVSAVSNLHWSAVVQAIDLAVTRAGLNLLVINTRDDPPTEAAAINTLLAHHVEGLILAPSLAWEERAASLLRENTMPWVLVDRPSRLRVDQVRVTNVAPSKSVVRHLIDLGHTRIGMVSGNPNVSTSGSRIEGFVQAHVEAGLDIDPRLIVCGNSSAEGGAGAMAALLDLPEPPTAVFTANNSMTVGAMTAMRARRVRVPRDIALVAFDDHPWADAFEPRLTTVAQPNELIGTRAVDLLLRRLRDPGRPHERVTLDAEIVHRTSCGCPDV